MVIYEDSEWPAQKGRVIFSSNNNEKNKLDSEGIVFDVEQLLPENLLDQHNCHNLLVAPLQFQDETWATLFLKLII